MAKAGTSAPARAAEMAETTESTNVATIQPGGPAALTDDMRAMYEEDAGQGVSTRAEDKLLPFVGILQKGSPQVNRQDPEYVEGAEPGMFLMKGSAPTRVLWAQPLVMQKKFVEWIPRDSGGGFVGRHDALPGGVSEIRRKNRVVKWSTADGHEIIDTRYQYVNILEADDVVTTGVISFSGTGHTKWMDWNTTMGKKRLQSGAVAPSYSNLYRLGTKWQKNAQGDWFGLVVLESRWIQPEERQLVLVGREMMKQILAGAVSAEEPGGQTADEEHADDVPF